MAEDTFKSNTRSPRFSTREALGFSGGSTDPATGNLIPGAALEKAGINQKPPASGAPAAQSQSISRFNSSAVPRPPSMGRTLATQGLGALASGALDRVGRGVADGSIFKVDVPKFGGGIFNPGTGAETFPLESAQDVIGTPLPDISFGDVGPVQEVADADLGSFFGDQTGAEVAADTGGFFSDIGSGCFITEAVMSSGGADNGMELETLRMLRDNILAQTPQGQALIAEYEAIAPIVVEAVSMRQDGLQIFQRIKAEFIDPAVAAVQAGDYAKALQVYAQMIGFVTPFAAEAAECCGPMGAAQGEEMEMMGNHAAALSAGPEAAGAYMPGGQGMMGGQSLDSSQASPAVQPGQRPMGGMPMSEPQAQGMMPMTPQAEEPNAIGQVFARRRY